ncbi:MAG: peptidoglycan DD-metalloendopeptidase family protein [Alphaproteobacteria bacterium]|nr:peptidoglycan DD-metalloendopeptidase family protein [Alphaproteobacteria bacterium]
MSIKKKTLFQKMFPPRQFMLSENDRIKALSVAPIVQCIVFVVFCFSFVWLCVSTGICLYQFNKKADYDGRLEFVTNKYENLSSEVAALNDRIIEFNNIVDNDIAQVNEIKLMQNTKGLLPVSKAEEVKRSEMLDIEFVENKTNLLKSEIVVLQNRLQSILDNADINGEKVKDHKVEMQRDIAMAQISDLKDRISELENLIVDMQDAQVQIYRKMSYVANTNIKTIEKNLSNVASSLKVAGVGLNSLIGRVKNEDSVAATGGPFVPPVLPVKVNKLNIALASLNDQLTMWNNYNTLQDVLPIGKPVDRIRVTSTFGSRGDPFQNNAARHEGVDIGGIMGEPVYVTAPGKVVRTGEWGWYGNMIEIDHGLGFRTRYAHLDKILVSKDDAVRAGDKIGTVGNTGRSTGPHLHYEVRIRGYAVDPMSFIKGERNVFKN